MFYVHIPENNKPTMTSYGGQAADGMRAQRLAKERELERGEAEFKKRKLAESLKVDNITSKFASTYDAVEQEIKASTVSINSLQGLGCLRNKIISRLAS